MLSDMHTGRWGFTLPRAWILGVSAVLWLIPGLLLLRFAFIWTDLPERDDYLLGSVLALGAIGLGYRFWFRRIVLRNIDRIRSLPARSMIWRVASPAGYGIMALMIAMGFVLRSSDLPRLYLAGPYALMGGCLLLGSIHTASTFLREIRIGREPS